MRLLLGQSDPQPSWWEQAIIDAGTFLLESVVSVYSAILTGLDAAVGALVLPVVDLVPDAPSGVGPQVQQYMEWANCWVPVGEAIGLVLIYTTCRILWLPIVLLIRAIPGVGG